MTLFIKSLEIDVTPSLQVPICGFGPPAESVETPIYLRLLWVQYEKKSYIIGAIEFCILSGVFHAELRECTATQLNVPFENITIHTSHQHDVPAYDECGHKTAEKYNYGNYDSNHWKDFIKHVKKELPKFLEINFADAVYYSVNYQPIHEYASDRRLLHEGKLYWRSTKCQDPFLKSLPQGDFDPNLNLFAFYDQNKKLLATMSFYASHPQVANGRNLISSDAPGFALKCLKEAHPQATHIYFDGCGGDIGNGKWANEDITGDIQIFGGKLFEAMNACLNNARLEVIDGFSWKDHSFDLELKKFDCDLNDLKDQMNGIKEPTLRPVKLLRTIGLIEKNISSYPFRATHVSIGKSNLIFLPSELFCEYQIYIKKKLGEGTCIAAYGDGFFAYVPQDHDFELGGYEIDGGFQVMQKGCEVKIKLFFDKIF